MAPRTPRQNHTAGPFITLSLTKAASSNPGKSLPYGAPSVRNSPVIPTRIEKKSSSKKTAKKPDLVLGNDLGTTTSTPVGERQRLSQTTSPTTSVLDNSLLPFKYSTPSTSQAVSQEDEVDFIKSAEKGSQSLTNSATKELPNSLDGQFDRRSSTASLTDTGNRSSGRARKLTSKAQALAGTRFLPSLQTSPEIEVVLNQNNNNVADEQVAQIAEDQLPHTPTSEIHETITNETPMESVETTAVRTSARERKPTARAVELETTRASRKRPASPASPVGSERGSKSIKKSPSAPNKPSKLRHSAVSLEEASPNTTVMTPKNLEQELKALVGNVLDRENSKSPVISHPKHICTDNVVSRPDISIITGEAAMAEVVDKSETQKCNLTCLSPSSRLLAYAKFVAEWSDSDGDSDDDDGDEVDLDITSEVVENTNRLVEKACEAHCKCRSDTSKVKPPAALSETILQAPTGPIEVLNEHSINHEVALPIADVNSLTRPTNNKPTGKSIVHSNEPSKPISSKRQKVSHKKPDLKRQDSSFERRMQTDYLATLREKAVGLQDKSKQLALAVTQSERRKPLLPTNNSSPRILRHRSSNTGLANGSRLNSVDSEIASQTSARDAMTPNNHSFVTLKMAKRDNNQLKLVEKRSSNEHDMVLNTNLPDPQERSTVSNTAVKITKTADKIGIQESRKTTTGGSVRVSLHDNSVGEQAPVVKGHQGTAPSQTKSIKLRFTTTAK